MKLRTKFTILTAVAVTVAIGNSVVSEWAGDAIQDYSHRQTIVSDVIQRHMDADMVHDANWGDVMTVLYSAKTGEKEVRKQRTDDFKKHAEIFSRDVQQNLEVQELPEDIKAQLQKVQALLKPYMERADMLIKDAD